MMDAIWTFAAAHPVIWFGLLGFAYGIVDTALGVARR